MERTGAGAAVMEPGYLLHTRTYEIESRVENDNHFRLIGHLRDVHPDGMWGINDIEPMTIHHMELHVVVHAATLQITEVFTKMHVHPQEQCPIIESAYQGLVGLSIARGFTHKVREMFGGPKACTHIGALVLAMAPVAIQSLWPFMREHMPTDEQGVARSPETNRREFERSRDTCHVWASDGPMFEMLEHGEGVPLPLWALQRLRDRGIDVSAFTGPL